MSVPKFWRSAPSPIPRRDPNNSGPSGLGPDHDRYRCAVDGCEFQRGGYLDALQHHVNTTHDVVLRKMPHWGAVKFPVWQTRKESA